MLLSEIVEGLLGSILELVRRIIVDLFLGVFIDGPGFLVLRAIHGPTNDKLESDRSGCMVTFAGMIFWVAVAGIAYGVHHAVTAT